MAEVIAIATLVQNIMILSDSIIQAARGVYHLQERCAELGRLVEEIRSSLGTEFRRFNGKSRDRLLQLRSALEEAEVFVRDMTRRRNAILPVVFGGASRRLDDIEEKLHRCSALLALHIGLHNHRRQCKIFYLLFGIVILGILVLIAYIAINHKLLLSSTFKGWVLHRLHLLERFHNFILV